MTRRKICTTALRRNLLFGTLGALLLIGFLVGAFFGIRAVLRLSPKLYEENTYSGMPDLELGEDGFVEIDNPEVCRVYLCQKPKRQGKELAIYLTNPAENDCSVRVEVFEVVFSQDEEGQTTYAPGEKLGETYFVKPGEYLPIMKIQGKQTDKELPLLIKIGARDNETGVSLGTFYVQGSAVQ